MTGKTKRRYKRLIEVLVIVMLAVGGFPARNTAPGHFVSAHLHVGPHMSCELKLTEHPEQL